MNRFQLEATASRDALADIKRAVRQGVTREDAVERLIQVRAQTLRALSDFASAFDEAATRAESSIESLNGELELLSSRFRADIARARMEWSKTLESWRSTASSAGSRKAPRPRSIRR